MSWNYRYNNGWQTSTVKQRKNGQWVTISSGDSSGGGDGSEAPSRFYTDGPPERSGTTITYDGNSHSSLQAAYESLSEGDTLYIDPINSPYVERLRLAQNPTNHITIRSDGELSFNANGAPTIEQQGAVIRRPDEDYLYTIGSQLSEVSRFSDDTSINGSHGNGDTILSVDDASAFSIGDVIYIFEDRVPYDEGTASGGSYHPDETYELRTITDIRGNDLELDYQLLLPFPDTNATEVGRADWVIDDLHVTGLRIEADQNASDNARPFYLHSVKDAWVDHNVVSDSSFHAMQAARLYRPRYDRNYALDSPNRYGFSAIFGTTHAYITNFAAENINRYAVRIAGTGGGQPGSCDALVDGVYGANFSDDNAVVNFHWGGFHIDCRNVYAGDVTQCSRMRSRFLTLEDSVKTGSGNRPMFVFAQRTYDCTVRNVTVDSNSDGDRAFYFRMRDGNNSPLDGAESEKHSNVLIENVDIGTLGSSSITDIGSFGIEGDPEPSGPITFRNVTYDGQQLTESDVTSWDGWDSNYITDLTVE